MAIDGTISEFFFRSSIKKYFIDNLRTIESKLIVFDRTILYEEVAGYDTDDWFVVNFGPFNRDLLSEGYLEINCCTRNDSEGVKLSKLTDLVYQYLYDPTKTDTLQRVTIYDSTNSDASLWTEVGTMIITNVREGQQVLTPDKTKVKSMLIEFTWGSIC